MTAMPPAGGDPLAEVADWVAEKLPAAIRSTGGGLARLASGMNKLADTTASLLRNLKEK